MKIFKTDKRIRLINELKSWAWVLITTGVLVFFIFRLSSMKLEHFWNVMIVTFLMKLSDTLFQYHVDEIRIDAYTNKLFIGLSSLLSGNEEKIYDLDQVQVTTNKNFRLNKWLIGPKTINILLPKNKIFKISGRYGFSEDSLNEIESAIKSKAFIANTIQA